jgi:hypothetical protein
MDARGAKPTGVGVTQRIPKMTLSGTMPVCVSSWRDVTMTGSTYSRSSPTSPEMASTAPAATTANFQRVRIGVSPSPDPTTTRLLQ